MTLRCVRIAPFETPVVPPVYCRKAMSLCPSGGVEALAAALRQGRLEAHGAGQVERRHHLLHLAHHQVHYHALQPEHLAERGDHDVLERRLGPHLLQHRGEVLQDDDRLGARVAQLVLELARGVEGIDVDDGTAGAQRAEHRDRVLQAVRQHDRHPRALGKPLCLQPRAEVARQPLEVGVADRPAHAGERRPGGELLHGPVEHLHQARVFRGIDIRRHARGIALQPDALHFSS
jgi:hypothetical protein